MVSAAQRVLGRVRASVTYSEQKATKTLANRVPEMILQAVSSVQQNVPHLVYTQSEMNV